MFLLQQPSDQQIRSFISAQQQSQFSYGPLGLSRDSTRERAPVGYNFDHNRVQLGAGPAAFDSAMAAIRRWKMFDVDWMPLCWDDTPIETGANVAILVKHLGFWSINGCRIVYVIDEPERYGFAYGTLTEHAEIGEEQFMVEWNRQDDSVWYDLVAVSKPRLMARFGYPYARSLQRRFARDSKRAMQRAVLQ
jgi:uncharacterized protein (UPF0548 family)